MTIKSIPSHLHALYAMDYHIGLKTIDELVEMTGRSRRTVIRMLEEQGVYHPRTYHRKPKPVSVEPRTSYLNTEEFLQTLVPTPEGIPVPVPEYVPEPAHELFTTPLGYPQVSQENWLQRAVGLMKTVFRQVTA